MRSDAFCFNFPRAHSLREGSGIWRDMKSPRPPAQAARAQFMRISIHAVRPGSTVTCPLKRNTPLIRTMT